MRSGELIKPVCLECGVEREPTIGPDDSQNVWITKSGGRRIAERIVEGMKKQADDAAV